MHILRDAGINTVLIRLLCMSNACIEICILLFLGGKDACYGDSGGPMINAETKVCVNVIILSYYFIRNHSIKEIVFNQILCGIYLCNFRPWLESLAGGKDVGKLNTQVFTHKCLTLLTGSTGRLVNNVCTKRPNNC